jgi:hypothetical protein
MSATLDPGPVVALAERGLTAAEAAATAGRRRQLNFRHPRAAA